MAGTMSVRSRRAPITSVALVALAAVLLSGACSLERSGYQYVRNRSTGTYLKVPDQWTVYGQRAIEESFGEQPEEGSVDNMRFPFISVFDGTPDSELDFDVFTDNPMGVVRVRELTDEERDGVSFATARDELFPLNDAFSTGSLPIHKAIEVNQSGAQGQRIVFTYTDEESGTVSTIDQTTLVDHDKNRLYLLVVGCEARCYDKHKKEIETVVESLTIKET
jgi:hypothetical protein